MTSFRAMALGALVVTAIVLSGCDDLVLRDTQSLVAPRFQRCGNDVRRGRLEDLMGPARYDRDGSDLVSRGRESDNRSGEGTLIWRRTG